MPSKRWIRITAVVLGVFVGLAITCVFSLQIASGVMQNRTHPVPVASLRLDATPDLARGGHLVAVGCMGCHGGDLGGHQIFDDFPMGRLWSANLTTGAGGIGKTFSDADLVRALRYGVAPDSHTVLYMPARSFSHLSDADLASIVAFLRTVPPVNRERPRSRLGPVARVLTVLTPIPLFAADQVEANPDRTRPPTTDTLGYGAYIAHTAGCIECHGSGLAGDFGPNLTPGGPVGKWDEATFVRVMRTGKRPDGTTLTDDMPWKDFSKFDDIEIAAVWRYMRSVPAIAPKEKKS